MADENSARGAPTVAPRLVTPSATPSALPSAPLVAVVTPVYNGAEFLAETLACVQRQTYPNLVHVVLDNASTDGTPGIVARAARGRVPVLAHRNPETLPLRQNWERAVRLTPPGARYFLLLCADDLVADTAVAEMVAVAERDAGVGVVGCLWRLGTSPDAGAPDESGPEGTGPEGTGRDGTRSGEVHLGGTGLPGTHAVFDGRWFVKSYLLQMHFGTSPQCQLFRRSVLDEVPALYRHDEMLMDVDACLRTLLRWRYGFVHASLGFTRAHESRITNTLMAPGKAYEANWLALIDRYGPEVMSDRELRLCRAAYARHYLRRTLLWRFREGSRPLFDQHRSELRRRAVGVTPLNYGWALVEWIWQATRGRRWALSRPTALWSAAWKELAEPAGRPGLGGGR